MRTKLEEGETTKWRVYQVGRGARLRPGVAPREREGGVDAGRRVRCTDTSPLMNAPGMCEGFYVRRRRRRRRHHSRRPSTPLSPRHHYHQPRIGRHPRRPTSASSPPVPSNPPSTPAALLLLLLFLFPRSSPFLLHASLSLSPSSLLAQPFSLQRVEERATTQPSRVEPRFPARGTQRVALVAARGRRAPLPRKQRGRILSRSPRTLRSWGCARFSPPPACLRTYPAPAIGTHNRPYANPLLHLHHRPLLSSLLVYPLSRFTRLPLPSHSHPPSPSLTPSLLSSPLPSPPSSPV